MVKRNEPMQLRMYRCTATAMDSDDTIIAYYEAASRADALKMFEEDEPLTDRWVGQAEPMPTPRGRRGLTHKVDFDAEEEA